MTSKMKTVYEPIIDGVLCMKYDAVPLSSDDTKFLTHALHKAAQELKRINEEVEDKSINPRWSSPINPDCFKDCEVW